MANPEHPLSGTLIVDLSRHLPGPYAARLLASLGARVVKVEEPGGGDPVRLAPPFRNGRSRLAEALLSGVESIALDLKKDGGLDVLRRIVRGADVVLESFRPGTLARLGLAPRDLCQDQPRLVVCSLSGWGAAGPLAMRAGHDLTYQARSGALAATGAVPNLPSADLQGAWSAVASICAALFARERTGTGTWIDASMYDANLVGNVTNLTFGDSSRKEALPGPLTGALPCYRLYEAGDGRLVAIAALERKFWRLLCQAVDRPDLVAVQYRTDRSSHRKVGELFRSRESGEWQELFTLHDLPGEVVLTPVEALAEGHARSRGLASIDRGGLPFPVVIGGARPVAGDGFPGLGENTDELLREFCPDKLTLSRRARRASGIGPRRGIRRVLRRVGMSLGS